jgi:hypothetical protein
MRRLSFASSSIAFVVLGFFTAAPAGRAQAQDQKGPIPPPPKFEVHRISNQPTPPAPPVPEPEIIKRFAANEDLMKKEYDESIFNQTVRVEEETEPGGKFAVTGEVYTKPDGQRYMRVTKPPESDLNLTSFSLEDVRTIASLPLFALTSDEIANYNFQYSGTDKLDDLNTYVFQVKPKQLSRKRRFFEGAIWVDDRDFVIVKSYGKFVSEIAGNGTKLPFSMFETYRENLKEKYWLPTYTRSDDSVPGPNGVQLPLRLIIRSTNFKLYDAAVPASPDPRSAAAPAPPGNAPPANPPGASSTSTPATPSPSQAPPSGSAQPKSSSSN